MARVSKARIGAVSPTGRVIEILPATGNNRSVQVKFVCAHCGGIGSCRWAEFNSENDATRQKSCRCLRTKYVNRQIDQAMWGIYPEAREAIAGEVEVAGVNAGIKLAQLLGFEHSYIRYAVAKIRKHWREEFLIGLDVIIRTKFWMEVKRSGIEAAQKAMAWTKAQALAVFRLIKKGLTSITETTARAANLASYRLKAEGRMYEFSHAVYGPKAGKTQNIRWALNTVESQVVTDDAGLAALKREAITRQRRSARRLAFIERIKAGSVDTYEGMNAAPQTNDQSCWPSQFSVASTNRSYSGALRGHQHERDVPS
ncbi:hypothetical protein P8936_12335 [Edaphobacter paludis]|uniref:Uncharacterized protein n=1 Tax=Edaphobacter paludis TaxID=3035702 RepID=A0AAU7D542_9BACT